MSGWNPPIFGELSKTGKGPFEVIFETSYLDIGYPIRPKDIKPGNGTVGKFGKHEVEAAAFDLLMFFKDRGFWSGFSISEILLFFEREKLDSRQRHRARPFFGLIGAWYDDGGLGSFKIPPTYFVLFPDGKYYPTDLFIEACAAE